MYRRLLSILLLAGLVPFGASAQRPLLTVDAVQGQAWVYAADGTRTRLAANDEIDEGGRIVTDADARVNMRLSRHGHIDLGPASELVVETLPFSSYATRLRTEVQLDRGELRVVWKHPQISTTWPIYIGLANLRASLSSGEYFFERRDALLEACVAAGQIALDRDGSPDVETLKPIACYGLSRKPAVRQPRTAQDWVARRRDVRAAWPAVASAAGPRARRGRPATGDYVEDYRRVFMNDGPRVEDDAAFAQQRSRPFRVPEAEPQPPVAVAEPVPVAPAVVQPRQVVTAADATTVLPEGDGKWALVVGSFAAADAAQPLAEQLAELGYPVDIQQADVRGRTWYRVRVTGYDTVARANRASADIAARAGVDGAWVAAR